MTVSHKRVQRGVNPGGVSLVSISASPGVEGVVARDPVITDDYAHRRAESLDAEAAYYRHRAIQEEQALGAGYYVDLLREMATDQAAMALRIRPQNAAT
jgi:hypothetical protein